MSIQDHLIASNLPTGEGILAEYDYAQLEIRILALASMDNQLIEDINSGRDMHTVFASKIFDKPEEEITKTERRTAKTFSFELQYGGGAENMAKRWGVPVSLTEAFIEEYYRRYPKIKKYQQRAAQAASDTLIHMGDRRDGVSVPRYYVPSIWKDEEGKPLTQYAVIGSLSKKGRPYPPPTQVKNYPIQGAGADIMLMMLNKLSREIRHTSAWLINTVHDSVLCEITDSKNGENQGLLQKIADILSTVPEELKKNYGVDSPIDFPVDYSTGYTLTEVKKKA